ncbi:MAG: TlpA disulfide reductase family protein [Dehalococcoidia bacterium]|nr:TlpA disulfide reductase family protein [Dehalococcoidia bacterium]
MTTTPQSKKMFRRFILGAGALILLLGVILTGLIYYAADMQANKNLETESESTTETEKEVLQKYGLITSGQIAEIGLSAPDFLLIDALSGEEIKLSNYIGKPIILNFWASWCGPCKIELPELQALQIKHGDDLIILAVNGDRESREQIQYFGSKFNLTFNLLRDPKKEVTKAYGVWGLPKTLFIDRDGVIQKQYTGSINQEIIEQELLAFDLIQGD